MSQEAWNRWRPDGERGARNCIGAAEVKRATARVPTDEVLRLAQLLDRPPSGAPLGHARKSLNL